MDSFFKELKRRNVFRVAVAYAVIGWLLLQIADILTPALRLPESLVSAITLILILGFIPTLLFSWAFELTPEGIKREKDIERDESITHVTAKKLDYITLFAVVVLIGLMIANRFIAPSKEKSISNIEQPSQVVSTDNSTQEKATEGSFKVTDVVSEKSIAVLPFVNMSSDSEQDYFSDGLTESLLHLLAQVDELRVAARTSSFYFKGKNEDMTSIGKQLRVAHLLEGSVRSHGDKIRITAQLIKVDNGFHLWSGTYDRTKDDIFAIQDEISHAVVEALKVKLLDQLHDTESIGGTISSRAYDEYIKGRQDLNIYSYESLPQAIEHFEAAIKEDPNYLLAYQGLGETYSKMAFTGLMNWREVGLTLKPIAESMLRIDERSGAAFVMRGLSEWSKNQSDPLSFQHYIEKGYELSPENPFVGDWMARFYRITGKGQRSIIIYKKLLSKDPMSADLHSSLSLLYNRDDINDKALFHALQSANLAPEDPSSTQPLENIYAKTLEMQKANELLLKSEKIDTKDHEIPATIAFNFLSVLLPENALIEIEKAEKTNPQGQMTLAAKATYYFQIGEVEQSKEIINKLIDDNESSRGSDVNPSVGRIIEYLSHKSNTPELIADKFLPWAKAEITNSKVESITQYFVKLRYIDLIESIYGKEHAQDLIKNAIEYKAKSDDLDKFGIQMAMATKNKEALLSGLEKESEVRVNRFWWLEYSGHRYDWVREEPRFKAIQAKIMEKVKQQQIAITGKAL